MDFLIGIFDLVVIVTVTGLFLVFIARRAGVKVPMPDVFDPFHPQPMIMGVVALVFAVLDLASPGDVVVWIPTPIFVALAFGSMIYHSLRLR